MEEGGGNVGWQQRINHLKGFPVGPSPTFTWTPSPLLLPDLSIFLPASEKMSAVPEKAGAAACGLPPAPEPPTGNASWAAPLCQHSRCFVVAGFFLTFLLVKSNFQMQERNTSGKSWTQQ